jgi:AcrR family transcriptional regulator
VYYYFKTKDALVQAVVEAHLTEASTMLAAIDDAYPGPASGSRRCSAPSPSKAT